MGWEKAIKQWEKEQKEKKKDDCKVGRCPNCQLCGCNCMKMKGFCNCDGTTGEKCGAESIIDEKCAAGEDPEKFCAEDDKNCEMKLIDDLEDDDDDDNDDDNENNDS